MKYNAQGYYDCINEEKYKKAKDTITAVMTPEYDKKYYNFYEGSNMGIMNTNNTKDIRKKLETPNIMSSTRTSSTNMVKILKSFCSNTSIYKNFVSTDIIIYILVTIIPNLDMDDNGRDLILRGFITTVVRMFSKSFDNYNRYNRYNRYKMSKHFEQNLRSFLASVYYHHKYPPLNWDNSYKQFNAIISGVDNKFSKDTATINKISYVREYYNQ